MENIDRNTRPQVVLVNRALILNSTKHILLIKRAEDDVYMPGKWEFPGGKLDMGQDISDALEREILEETGLAVIPIDKIAYYSSKIIPDGKYMGLPYIVLIGIMKCLNDEVTLSEEHSDFKWVTVGEALKCDLVPETRMAITVLANKIEK